MNRPMCMVLDKAGRRLWVSDRGARGLWIYMKDGLRKRMAMHLSPDGVGAHSAKRLGESLVRWGNQSRGPLRPSSPRQALPPTPYFGPMKLGKEDGCEWLEMSVRTANILQAMGVDTIGDISKLTEKKILAEPHATERTVRELKRLLEAIGLTLRVKKAASSA